MSDFCIDIHRFSIDFNETEKYFLPFASDCNDLHSLKLKPKGKKKCQKIKTLTFGGPKSYVFEIVRKENVLKI